MSNLLLATKLFVPLLRPDLVSRPRLIERLDKGLRAGAGVILLCAPAGFGKTTLVAEWLQHLRSFAIEPPGIAWLDLDEGDSDPARFFAYLVAAFRSIDPTLDQGLDHTLAEFSPPAQPTEPLLTALINQLGTQTRPLVVVLDDYHLIKSLAVHEQLAFLLEHRPPQMRLVILSREDPPLPLGRLRAGGQVIEVRQADLEFNLEEALAFLDRTAPGKLSPSGVTVLHERTEGWIAGLQLAALSMPEKDQADLEEWLQKFSGSHRYMVDYLMEEVLGRLPPALEEFLLTTSILDRLTSSLCDAVTARADSRQMLTALEEANLFLVPLDDSRLWYRYHHLFADVLRHRFNKENPGQIPLLHRRASEWYSTHNFPTEAIRHALAASDWDRAAELILGGTSAALLERGELMTLLSWFRAFPEPIVRASPRLCCEYAWPLILTGQTQVAQSYLEVAESIDQKLAGKFGESSEGLKEGWSDVFTEEPLALVPAERLPGRALILVNLGTEQWYRGNLERAEELLAEALDAARESKDIYTKVVASIYLNGIKFAHGKLRRGAQACARLVEESGLDEKLPILALAYFDLSGLYFEWNDLERAARYAEDGLALCARGGCGEIQAAGYANLALVRQAQGQVEAAKEALRQGNKGLESCSASPAGKLFFQTVRLLVALEQGNLEEASLVEEEVPAPNSEEARAYSNYLALLLAVARLRLARGQREITAREAARLYEMACRDGWQNLALKARLLQVLAAPTPEDSLALLGEAVEQAEPEGYIRSFLAGGEPVAALLGKLLARGDPAHAAYVRQLLAAFAVSRETRSSSRPPKLFSAGETPGLVEPLSQREFEVLALLPRGLTNLEIASRLCVSENTIKTHLASIYSKLGVNSRREAVSQAQKAGILTS